MVAEMAPGVGLPLSVGLGSMVVVGGDGLPTPGTKVGLSQAIFIPPGMYALEDEVQSSLHRSVVLATELILTFPQHVSMTGALMAREVGGIPDQPKTLNQEFQIPTKPPQNADETKPGVDAILLDDRELVDNAINPLVSRIVGLVQEPVQQMIAIFARIQHPEPIVEGRVDIVPRIPSAADLLQDGLHHEGGEILHDGVWGLLVPSCGIGSKLNPYLSWLPFLCG